MLPVIFAVGLGCLSLAVLAVIVGVRREMIGWSSLATTAVVADELTWVGGYTVAGRSISTVVGADGTIEPSTATFAVAQECICSCNATDDGAVLCLGANPGNAFSAVAYHEDGTWFMEQQSINGSGGVNYHATFRFGQTPGGAHSATGYALIPSGGASTQFRASQSKISCSEGVGASACAPLCDAHGIDTTQIRAKCGL